MNKTKFFSSLLVGLLVTTGLFTSCKDYDDDIKNLQQQIDQKSLKTDLESLKTSLEARLATLESTLNTKEAALKAEIEKKADKTDLTALAARVKVVEDLTAEIAGIKTKIATIEATLGTKADQSALDALKLDVDKKADKTALQAAYDELLAKIAENAQGDQADEQALQNAIATLTGKIDERLTEAQVKAIVDESAAAQAAALEALKLEINGKLESLGLTKADIEKLTDVNNKIAAIEDALKAFTGAETIEEAKEKMQELAEKIDENIAAIDVLEAFVQKQLTSMVLMPSFYWEGLEGIEVPFGISPNFVPKKDYTFSYTTQGALGDETIEVKVAQAMTFGYTDKDGKASSINAEVAIADKGPWAGDAEGQAGPKNLTLAIAEKLKHDHFNNAGSVDTISLMQGGIAKYHYNPSTANLEGYKFSFFENDAEVYTRAAGAIVATPREDDIKAENGILTVPFDVDGGKLQSMFDKWIAGGVVLNDDQQHHVGAWNYAFGGGNKLPFLAAQMAKGDTIVTSDYGVIVPVTIDIIALADKAPLEKLSNGVSTEFKKPVANADCGGKIRENHLYESVGYNEIVIPAQGERNNYGAITMPATHEIVYSEKAFDLAQFVETHAKYTHYAKYGVSDKEVVLSKEELAALGLHYEFNIIDYTKANEKTGQSKHIIRVDANGAPSNDKEVGYFSVRSVDKDGNTMVNATATQETVGREPLIRVDLVNKDGKIIRYGYIKLLIVKDAAKDMSVTVDFGDIYMNCGDKAKMTWAEMENIILREIDMTKEDFEKLYHLDVIGNYDHMPYVNDPDGKSGKLYADAKTNKWMAKRYVKGEDGKYVLAIVDEENNKTDDDDLTMMEEYTVDNNWFGRVWYTPHDNLTETQKWDENTNVLEWNFGTDREAKNDDVEDASNMTETAYYQMMKVVDATYNSKGLNKNELSTVVRFIHKNGSSIYVTLKFAVGKIHFAWGDINNRVLDHWYDFANGYQENTRDTIEVYANVPTPALRNNDPLTVSDFTKDLKEYWLNSTVVPDIHDLTNKKDGRFNKFWNYTNDKTSEGSFIGEVAFQFRLPVKGDDTTVQNDKGEWINSKTVQYTTNTKDMKIQGNTVKKGEGFTWQVKGASGTTYTLYLAYKADPTKGLGTYNGKTGNQIVAVKQGKMVNDEVIASITKTGVIKYNGYEGQTVNTYEEVLTTKAVNSAATDILNYVGMYDATGKLIKDDYLDGQNGLDNKAFTAYVEINVSATNCYNPLMGKNCFNVRFLRPVNMWPAQTEWTDAPNDTQIYPLWKLVYIRDWRQFPVVPLDAEQQFGKAAKAGTGEDGKTYKGQIKAGTDGIVTYQFYSISNLYVKRADIRSDAYLSADKRTILTDPAKIAALKTIDEIPALTGYNASKPNEPTWQFLKIYEKQNAAAPKTWEEVTAAAAGNAATGLDESNSYENVLAYTNNSGVVKEFHIYVPVSLKYPWGSVTDWTQKVWAVITVKPTTGNE